MVFADIQEVHRAYGTGFASLHAKIKVRLHTSDLDGAGEMQKNYGLVETTVGRALLSELLPEGLPFSMVNTNMTKKAISGLINACYRRVGLKETVIFADQLMYTGW
jgi:DNA-directed RNA polymerase subunit beta'